MHPARREIRDMDAAVRRRPMHRTANDTNPSDPPTGGMPAVEISCRRFTRLRFVKDFSLVLSPRFGVTLTGDFNRREGATMTKAAILEKYPPRMENVLLILHDLQNRNPRNYLSEKDLGLVAGYLETTLGTIYGIASYYSMFSLRPRGRHIIRVCRSPVCHQAGGLDLLTELGRVLDVDPGETTADGQFTLETAECLGHCAVAPAMMVDDRLFGDLTRDTIGAAIDRFRHPRRSAKRPGP